MPTKTEQGANPRTHADERVPHLGNVLIADDDPDIRANWKKVVADRGGCIATVWDSADRLIGDTALDYTGIDTAIVDYEFRGESNTGIELIAHLKRHGVKTVYLCTGYYDDPEICRRACAAGAEKVLSKPICPDELC